MVRELIKLFKFHGTIIFVNNNHKKEFAIKNLLNISNKDCIFVYKTIPIYQVNEDQIVLSKFFFFIFSFILGIKFKNNLIMIFSQPYYAIPYFLLGGSISVYFYDVHIGLIYEDKIKIFIEKLSIIFFKNIIHRDLRLWVEYKHLLKKKKRKNILIPDFIHNEKNIVKKYNDRIKCAIVGWVDDKFVKVDKSIKILANLGVEIYFFTSKKCFDLSTKDLIQEKKVMKKIYYVGYLDSVNLENYLEDFSIGLCPHDAKSPLLSNNYRKYCSSMRVIDYIQNSLTIFLSDKTIFQRFINKKYNANYHNINDLRSIQSIDELKEKILIKDITYNNSIFNKKKLSIKLSNFLTLN